MFKETGPTPKTRSGDMYQGHNESMMCHMCIGQQELCVHSIYDGPSSLTNVLVICHRVP